MPAIRPSIRRDPRRHPVAAGPISLGAIVLGSMLALAPVVAARQADPSSASGASPGAANDPNAAPAARAPAGSGPTALAAPPRRDALPEQIVDVCLEIACEIDPGLGERLTTMRAERPEEFRAVFPSLGRRLLDLARLRSEDPDAYVTHLELARRDVEIGRVSGLLRAAVDRGDDVEVEALAEVLERLLRTQLLTIVRIRGNTLQVLEDRIEHGLREIDAMVTRSEHEVALRLASLKCNECPLIVTWHRGLDRSGARSAAESRPRASAAERDDGGAVALPLPGLMPEERRPLPPALVEKCMDIACDIDCSLADRLEKHRREQPELFMRTMQDVAGRLVQLGRLKDHDPQSYKERLEALRCDAQIGELARQLRAAIDGGEVEAAIAFEQQLLSLLRLQLALTIKTRGDYLNSLQARVTRHRQELEHIAGNFDELIAGQLATIRSGTEPAVPSWSTDTLLAGPVGRPPARGPAGDG